MMKLNLVNSTKSKRPREPLISFIELSEKFNVEVNQLKGFFNSCYQNTPIIVFKGGGNGTIRNSYYKKREAIKWLEELLAKRKVS